MMNKTDLIGQKISKYYQAQQQHISLHKNANNEAIGSIVSFLLVSQHKFQLFEELIKVFGDEVSSSRVFFGKVIGIFPLVDVVVSVGVVQSTVVIVHSLSDFHVSETNASAETSEVVNGDIVSGEEVKDLVGIGVLDVEDFLFGDAGIVGAVADWSGVVVRILFTPKHDMLMLNKIIQIQKSKEHFYY